MSKQANHIVIKKSANKAVVEFIKSEIASKKKRHKEILDSIDSATISSLKKMKKVRVSR